MANCAFEREIFCDMVGIGNLIIVAGMAAVTFRGCTGILTIGVTLAAYDSCMCTC